MTVRPCYWCVLLVCVTGVCYWCVLLVCVTVVCYWCVSIKVKRSRYRLGVAQNVGRGIDPVPILQEAGWALGQFWTGGKISSTTGIRYRTFQSVVSRYTD